MPYTFERPPRDLAQIYSYLYRMSEELEGALNNLNSSDIKDLDTKVGAAISTATAGTASAGHLASQAADLRALIIDTADVIESEMDRVVTEMEGKYVAQSDFGTLSESWLKETTEDATGREDIFTYIQSIDSMAQTGNDFRVEINAKIRTGFLYVDELGDPVFGVAIGQNVKDKEYTYISDGVTVTATGVDTAETLSIFTSKELQFWIGDTKAAYVSNNELYITRARMTREIRIGNLAGVIDGTDANIVRWYVKG